MARSIDPVVHAVRGFVPARTDEERFLMRHIEDLARTAQCAFSLLASAHST